MKTAPQRRRERFAFHFRPRNAWQERISFLMHGVHHAQPMEKTRLVMPPPVSIPLAGVFFGLFRLLFGPYWVAPLFSGLVTGYLIYDLTHYSLHHFHLPFAYQKASRAVLSPSPRWRKSARADPGRSSGSPRGDPFLCQTPESRIRAS